jgi:hypothetical protein
MRKYLHQDIYLLGEDELFQSRETMIEYVRDNWREYTNSVGENQKLVSFRDWEGKLILEHSFENEEGNTELEEDSFSYKIVQNTWMISEMDNMFARAGK